MHNLDTAFVQLRVNGKPFPAEGPVGITVPAGRVYASQMVPAACGLTDLVVAASAQRMIDSGHTISCRAGCGACCRQLVPLAEPEVYHLAEVIAHLSAERRAVVESRFADARILKANGMLETLLQPKPLNLEESRAIGMAYFRLGIACPFLEGESCSIHADRPVECREYLVTSPAENCKNPSPETVRCVPLSGKVSRVLGELNRQHEPDRPGWVAMIVAPLWLESHPRQTVRRLGHVMFEQMMKFVAHGGGND